MRARLGLARQRRCLDETRSRTLAQPPLDTAADAIAGTRSEQQDAHAFGTAVLSGGGGAVLYVLADGMGGHAGGRTAGEVAVETFLRVAQSGAWAAYPDLLRQGLMAANRAIGDRIEQSPQLGGMGCTLIGAVIERNTLWFISVGDSLILRVSGAKVTRLNADHSMAPMIDAAAGRGELSAEEAESHPQRHVLRSALVGRPLSLIDEGRMRIGRGDHYLVASDGIHTLSDARIAAIVGTPDTAETRVARLLRAVEAAQMEDQDNCTVCIMTPAKRYRRWQARFGVALLFLGVAIVGAVSWLATRPSGGDADASVSDPNGVPADAANSRPPAQPRPPREKAATATPPQKASHAKSKGQEPDKPSEAKPSSTPSPQPSKSPTPNSGSPKPPKPPKPSPSPAPQAKDLKPTAADPKPLRKSPPPASKPLPDQGDDSVRTV